MNKKSFIIFAVFLQIIITASSFSNSETSDDKNLFKNRPEYRQILSLIKCYPGFISRIEERGNDIVFLMNNGFIHYKNGRMLSSENLKNARKYTSIFYEYKKGRHTRLPDYIGEKFRPSRDFWYKMFGRTENQIRRFCRTSSFLNHSVCVNDLCMESLKIVEEKIFEAAEKCPEVRSFLKNLDIIYSFQIKKVDGTRVQSMHGFGLALDLIPKSFNRKEVYWKWSRVFNKKWYKIPLNKRWSPPQEVIDAFENNGFVWGGKWSRFDTIHFEYRPEILFNK